MTGAASGSRPPRRPAPRPAAALALSLAACVGSPSEAGQAPAASAPRPSASLPSAGALDAGAPPVDEACKADADCGYDPRHDRCGADPRFERQPPLVDQGILCYCEGRACALFHAWPVPCESDASCAVAPEPRPHPVAAGPAHPHERGRPCADFTIATTCERTNICTMHRLECPR